MLYQRGLGAPSIYYIVSTSVKCFKTVTIVKIFGINIWKVSSVLPVHCTCWSFNSSDEKTEVQRDKVTNPKVHLMGEGKDNKNMYTYTHVFKVKTLLIHWDTGIIMNPC